MSVRLEQNFVQAVRDAVDLVDLGSEHTRLERKGKRFEGLCPFHKEKTPSFSIDPDQGLYYCFGCGAGGDAIGFHMQATGDDFAGAIETLAERYGIAVPRGRSPEGEEQQKQADAALSAAQEFFVDQLRRASSPQGYLDRRQVSASVQERFGLGYAPDEWQCLLEALERRHPRAALVEAGLVGISRQSGRAYDRFRNRLMFPIRAISGRIVGFGGRTLGDDRAKYLNTAETAAFRKGSLLYNLDQARFAARESGKVLLVEGYFDVIAAVISGVEWAVASMGTALTPEQAKLMARYADEVVLGYDGDRAGEEAARKALPLLLQHGLGVRRARFPAGQDPDSLRLAEGVEAVQSRIEDAPDLIEIEIERQPRDASSDPRALSSAVEALRPLLAAIGDRGARVAYQRRAAEWLGVRPGLLGEGAAQLFSRSPRVQAPRLSEEESPGRGLEEQVLSLLLAGVSSAHTLPPADVFWGEERRAIYRALVDCLAAPSGSRPVDARVGDLLEPGSQAVTLLARLGSNLPQSSVGQESEALDSCLERLERRHHLKRLEAFSGEMAAAEQAGDVERFEQLLARRQELRDRLHPKRR